MVEGVGIEPFPSVEVREGRGNPYTPDSVRINLHNTPICDDEALGVTYQRLVKHGAMAQLVAHLHGMERVRGSNPLSSTSTKTTILQRVVVFHMAVGFRRHFDSMCKICFRCFSPL